MLEPIGLIPLAGHAVVDAADVPFLSLLRWHRYRFPSNPRTDYARAHLPSGGSVKLHRLLLLAGAGVAVDHWIGCGLDCRWSNLRLATSIQNAGNQRRRRGRAQYKGVSFRGNSPGHP
jgi:hypothetical protein